MNLPTNPDEYREQYGKRYRMLKEQTERGLSREEAFEEWRQAQGGFTPPTAPAEPSTALFKAPPPPEGSRPVLKGRADLCSKNGKCSCKGLKIGYDVDERRVRITDCTCECHET